MRISVQRGTHAGWKKPMQNRKGEWECACPADDGVGLKTQKGFMVKCPECGTFRDGDPQR